ncbi:MAG: transposase, partial [Candidatus Methanomethylophilaceae archaeon]|nr:transposase [Candidatus Methanomethylophilaceae archaeon]
ARQLSQDRGVRVLITNLPRANTDAENVRTGATADTVLLSYLDQYQVEHAFRLMKDGMGIDRVYIHRPSRENAMMFVISIATMVSDIVTHVLKENDIDLMMQGASGKIYSMDLVCEGDEEYLDGSPEHEELFMRMIEALRLNPDHLID